MIFAANQYIVVFIDNLGSGMLVNSYFKPLKFFTTFG